MGLGPTSLQARYGPRHGRVVVGWLGATARLRRRVGRSRCRLWLGRPSTMGLRALGEGRLLPGYDSDVGRPRRRMLAGALGGGGRMRWWRWWRGRVGGRGAKGMALLATERWYKRTRQAWTEYLVWRFGWKTVAGVRWETVEICGPFEEPS